MPEFNSIADLEAYINKQIQESLQTDVAQKVIDIAQDHVQTDVYDVYAPKEYTRTGQLKQDFVATPIPNGIEIENTRSDGERYIPEIIEYGHDKSEQGYEYPAYYPTGDNFIQPRPFIENTVKELETGNIHVTELKKSLQNKGFNIE